MISVDANGDAWDGPSKIFGGRHSKPEGRVIRVHTYIRLVRSTWSSPRLSLLQLHSFSRLGQHKRLRIHWWHIQTLALTFMHGLWEVSGHVLTILGVRLGPLVQSWRGECSYRITRSL